MNRHEWTAGSRQFLLESDGSLYEVPDVGEAPQVGDIPAFVAAETLRLATERARLRLLLNRCMHLAEGFSFNHPDEYARHFAADPILDDLRRELGEE
jgi:hypothetical protein